MSTVEEVVVEEKWLSSLQLDLFLRSLWPLGDQVFLALFVVT